MRRIFSYIVLLALPFYIQGCAMKYKAGQIERGFSPEDIVISPAPVTSGIKVDAAVGISVSIDGEIPEKNKGALKEKIESSLIKAVDGLGMFNSAGPLSESSDVVLDVKFTYSHVGVAHFEAVPVAIVTLMAFTPTNIKTKAHADVSINYPFSAEAHQKEMEAHGEGLSASEVYAGAGGGAVKATGQATTALIEKILAFIVETGPVIDGVIAEGRPLEGFFKAADRGDIDEVRRSLESGVDINTIDTRSGNAALHMAAGKGFVGLVSLLLDSKADIDLPGRDGMTALHFGAATGNEKVVDILIARGASPALRDLSGRTAAELAEGAGHKSAAEMIVCRPLKNMFEGCEKEENIDCYRTFISNSGDSACSEKSRVELARSRVLELMSRGQACRLDEENWIYRGSECAEGLAHGEGRAFHMERDLRFEGAFSRGKRVKGIIYQGETPLFDGTIVDGRPDGPGICFYDGEPEECKFYKGKRVDAVYKQRIEMAKQRKEIELMQKEMEKKIDEIKKGQAASRQPVQPSGAPLSSVVQDTVTKKATEMIIDEIFDRLF